jgi:hypothetical protein
VKPIIVLFTASFGLATAVVAQEQTQPVVARPAYQTTSYNSVDDGNGHYNSTSSTVYHAEVKATPVPTPVPVTMNHRSARSTEARQAAEPVVYYTSAPVVVTQGPIVAATANPSTQNIVSQNEIAAEYQKNVKSGKWKEFKNGE